MSAGEEAPSTDLWRLLARTMETPTRDHVALFEALSLDAPGDVDDWRAAHTAAFVTQCAPHVSVYLGETGQIGGEAAARVADFRRLLGAEVDTAYPDYLPVLLADYAELAVMAEYDPRAAHARHAMFWEHLGCWLAPFADAVERSAPAPYAAWAGVLRRVVRAEAAAVDRPTAEPLHLRAAAERVESGADTSRDGMVRALLAPATSGIVLTRADLAAAGRALGVALPVGTRAFLLNTLFQQDAPATQGWLAMQARRQARARAAEHDALGRVAAFWAERAGSIADRLSIEAASMPRTSGQNGDIAQSA